MNSHATWQKNSMYCKFNLKYIETKREPDTSVEQYLTCVHKAVTSYLQLLIAEQYVAFSIRHYQQVFILRSDNTKSYSKLANSTKTLIDTGKLSYLCQIQRPTIDTNRLLQRRRN